MKKIYMAILLSILIIFSNEKTLNIHTNSSFRKVEILNLFKNNNLNKEEKKLDLKTYIKSKEIKKYVFSKLNINIKYLTYNKIKGQNNLKFIE